MGVLCRTCIRATVTLVKQLITAKSGGPPVDQAAVVGFIYAWTLPRVVLFLGSIVGALVLLAQTYFVYRQNELFAKQNVLIEIQTEYIDQQTRLLGVQTDVARSEAKRLSDWSNTSVDIDMELDSVRVTNRTDKVLVVLDAKLIDKKTNQETDIFDVSFSNGREGQCRKLLTSTISLKPGQSDRIISCAVTSPGGPPPIGVDFRDRIRMFDFFVTFEGPSGEQHTINQVK